MEKWQCQQSSKFCETLKNKNPSDLQHWQNEHSKYFTECCESKNDKDLKDYDKEVKINTKDIFEKDLENGKSSDLEKRTQWNAYYRMIIPLKSKGNAIIKMTFEMSKIEKGVTDQDIEKTKQFILSINKTWNNNFTLLVTDTQNQCCTIKLPIQFAYKGEKIPNGERNPHKIALYKNIPISPEGIDRPRLERGRTFILATDPNPYNKTYTFIHEFGHALGLPDE